MDNEQDNFIVDRKSTSCQMLQLGSKVLSQALKKLATITHSSTIPTINETCERKKVLAQENLGTSRRKKREANDNCFDNIKAITMAKTKSE